jgi:magnesium chelatase family protein
LRIDIARAIAAQRKRQGKYNAELTPEEIQEYCFLNEECKNYLSEQTEENDFSARAIHGIIKVARTIADMAGNTDITMNDLVEAARYRKNEGGLDIML